MRIEDMNSRDYRNKLCGSIVTQLYPRHRSGKRIGIVTDGSRKSQKHCVVKWWNYNTGDWSTRYAHPRLSEVIVESPELGYFVSRDGSILYVPEGRRNRWSYGYHYPELRSKLDDYSILSLYGIYKPRSCPDYISKSQVYISNRTKIVTNNFIIEEVSNANR